jgi:hypothetical protein
VTRVTRLPEQRLHNYQVLRGRALKRHFACGSLAIPISFVVLFSLCERKKNHKKKIKYHFECSHHRSRQCISQARKHELQWNEN